MFIDLHWWIYLEQVEVRHDPPHEGQSLMGEDYLYVNNMWDFLYQPLVF